MCNYDEDKPIVTDEEKQYGKRISVFDLPFC